jgi:uncharacterized protein YggE
MKRTLALLVAAVVGVYLFAGRAPQQKAAVAADVPQSTNGIVVDGLGKASGTPDVMRVVLGVTVTRADVSAALSAANHRQASLIAALKKDGVAGKDLQTSDVSVSPSYNNRGRPNGYQVSETLTAKLRNLTKAGRSISDAVAAGGNESTVQGVSFDLEDNAALLMQARDAAFKDAEAKAERYAQLSHRTLGAVQLVAETSSPIAQPYKGLYDATAGEALRMAAPVPVQPGTSDLSVTVTVRWALS